MIAFNEYKAGYALDEESQGAAFRIYLDFMTNNRENAMNAIDVFSQLYRANGARLGNILLAIAWCANSNLDADVHSQLLRKAIEVLKRRDELGHEGLNVNSGDQTDFAGLSEDAEFLSMRRAMAVEQSAGIWLVDTSFETRVIPANLHKTGRGWLDAAQISSMSEQNWRPLAISLADWGRDSTAPPLPYASIILSRPTIPDAQKEKLAKQQARAAVALFQLGKIELVADLMRTEQPDARVRSYFQAYLTELKSDPATLLAEFLDRAPATRSGESIKSPATASLAISLGDFAEANLLTSEQIESILPHALKMVAEDIDPGVHGACAWLIRKLGRVADMNRVLADLSTGKVEGDRHWYLTKTSGDTFAIFEPAEVLMGSPITEAQRYGGPKSTDERLHRRKGGYKFAVATHETTVEQFSRFRKSHSFNRNYSREQLSPANGISWYDAVAYCNWLSQQEGLPQDQWCYTIDPQDPMKVQMAADFLSRRGYRLPTEYEWEYACRAGSRTSRPHGETKELLTRYAWYADNSGTEFTLPVGTLRPNDFGMFDMLGNILEWNQDFYESYSSNYISEANPSQSLKVDKEISRVLRGGSFSYQALDVRSAIRDTSHPDSRNLNYGFRASRTYD